MTDILERLLSAVSDETQSSGALLQEAADEINRLQKECEILKVKLQRYDSFSEPEC